ncbi:MAG: TolC family protein [Candidatus Cryptobacteroides sp.]
MKQIKITVLSLLFAGVVLSAREMPAEGSARELTLKECMEYALENSAKVEIQQTDIDNARVARRDAILAAFTPSISAGVNAYSNFGRSVDPQTNTYVSTTSFSNGYYISGSITLFNGFEAINNIKISRTSLQMGIDRETLMKDEICLATMEAFCNVVYYKELSRIVEDQLQTMKESLALISRQEELGMKGHADVVQAEADVADMEYNLITAQNQYEDALITLKDVMFWEPEQELAVDSESVGGQLCEAEGADLQELSEYASEHNPNVLVAKATMENAALNLRIAKWKFTPRLSLNGGWSTNYFTYPGQTGYTPVAFGSQFVNNGGEYVQLTLSFPIFDGLSHFSNLRRKKNALRRATAEYNMAMRDVRAEVARAVKDRDGAEAALTQAYKRENAQEQAWEMNMKKYDQGLISPIDYRKASDSYMSAKAERLNALLKLSLKNSVVKYYNGISYIEQF